jgi:hypothetical protein
MPEAKLVNLKLTCPCCGRDVWLVASVGGCRSSGNALTKHVIDIRDVIGTAPKSPTRA